MEEVMKIALIPPVSLLTTSPPTRYQLVLPHMYLSNEEYARHYNMMRLNGQFMILDNGAAEKEQVMDSTLAQVALSLRVNEVAMPDVLGNTAETLARSAKFNKQFGPALDYNGIHLGYVAQGRSVGEVQQGINAAMKLGIKPRTVYVPRLLLQATGEPLVRIMIGLWVRDHYPEVEVHFFGMDPYYMHEAQKANHMMRDELRGMDTSAPYNFTYGKQRIDDLQASVPRPENYFDLKVSEFDRELLDLNIRKLLAWTR
jgi:hypothetical protein